MTVEIRKETAWPASGVPTIHATSSAAPLFHGIASASVDLDRRTITGTITAFGRRSNDGRFFFHHGSLEPRQPLRRVKLLVDHDQTDSRGYMTEISADRLTASFYVPEGPEGDEALQKAADGTRDGLSVSVTPSPEPGSWEFRDGSLHVYRGEIYEVSLVAVPAFADAQVISVAAAMAPHPREETMNEAQLRAALAAGTITQAEFDSRLALIQASNQPAAPATPPAAPAQPAPPADAPATPAAPAAPAQPAPPVHAQNAPIVVPPGTAVPRELDVRAAAQITVEHFRNGGTVEGLSAALADTIPAGDAGQGFLRPTFLGKLWTASRVRRPLIDALGTPKSLTGLKAWGWRWGVKPTVPRYAGNKTAVHSEALTTIMDSEDAVDFAGGWDVARKYIDLGDAGFIEEVFTLATDDYRLQTEVYAGEVLLAAATPVGSQGSIVGALNAMSAGARAIGSELSTIQFGAGLWEEFANLPEDQVPWWLKAQGSVNLGTAEGNAGGLKFSTSPELADRAWLALDSRGASYHEVQPPIRVQAQNIANGGVDLGVFGYACTFVHDPRAILTGTVNAPAGATFGAESRAAVELAAEAEAERQKVYATAAKDAQKATAAAVEKRGSALQRIRTAAQRAAAKADEATQAGKDPSKPENA